MSDIAIRVENLSKQYRIGQRERYKALRDVITDAVASPFRRLRRTEDGGRKTEAPSSVPGLRSPVSGLRSPVPSQDSYIWALKDVSFEVKQGEVVGIIGRNGAGKSTLLKILSRITKPTEGRAEVHGRIGSLLEVGTGFHPELTGRENTYLNGAILGMKKAEIDRKFDEIVAFAEIEQFIDTPVKHYSSGMYVRLAFAVAAHLEPEILLVDEVLAVGDAAFQKKCLGKMGETATGGRTVLFVSHNMGAVNALCPSAILLESGRVVTFASSAATVQNYLSRYISVGANVSLEDEKLHRGGKHFRVQRVVITDASNTPCAQIPFGQSFQVHLELDLRRDVSALHVGVGIATPDGTRLTTTHHSDTLQSTNFHRGKAFFRCTFEPNLLAPGTYYLHVGAHSEDSLLSDYVPEALAFEVLPISVESNTDFLPRNYGHFRHPAIWFLDSVKPRAEA